MLNNDELLIFRKDRLPAVTVRRFSKKIKNNETINDIRIKRHTEVWQSGQMRQTVNLLPSGYVRFESHIFHNERRNSSLTYWYIKNLHPKAG